jgi:hypothetical protein
MFSFSSDLAHPMMMSGTILLALAIISMAALTAWREWLDLQRAKLQHHPLPVGRTAGEEDIAARIEMADLRERLRQLEAIAAGVDL